MKRDILASALGAILVASGVFLAVSGPTGSELSTGGSTLLAFVVLGALVGTLLKVHGRLDAPDGPAAPWASTEPFASPTPEESASDYPPSSVDLARIIENACERARAGGTVADGIEVVRPALRETLVAALVAGGIDEEEAFERLLEGEWTDDRLAASVLDENVDPPEQSLRQRFEAWLFPERVLRRRTRQAMGAVAVAAEEALPTVSGQTAPRSVPVIRPALPELRRGVDGRLQEAVDPMAVARGPLPPEPTLEEWAERTEEERR